MRTVIATLATGAALLLTSPAFSQEGCPDYAADIAGIKPLEPKAFAGQLSESDIRCLERGYESAAKQTDKSKISRVLLANAQVTDSDEWVRLVRRHLDEVERSDPDIAYMFANFLFNQESPDFNTVVQFADVAWERRTDRWEGRAFVVRSHHLLRMRSMSLMMLWKAEAEQFAGSEQEPPTVANSRLKAHTAAREWLDFDRASDLPFTEAANLCVATGTESGCGLKPGWQKNSGT